MRSWLPVLGAAACALSCWVVLACAGRSGLPPNRASTDTHAQVGTSEPVVGTEGFSKPRMKEPECMRSSLRLSAALRPLVLPQVVAARFAIGREGQVSRFALTTPIASDSVQRAIARTIEDAVRACEWIPGRDRDGNAVSIWVVLPVSFTQPPEREPARDPRAPGRPR